MSQPHPPADLPQFTAPPGYGGYAGQPAPQHGGYPQQPGYGPGSVGPSVQPGPTGWAAQPGQVVSSAPYGSVPAPVRPAEIPMAATLAVTASLQFACGLGFFWLVATAAMASLANEGVDSGLFHLFNRFHDRMLDGLAWPLFLFPVASFFTGFLILSPQPWTRLAHTLVGALALVWSGWWLRDGLLWWLIPAAYIGVACGLLWTSGASRWYAAAGRRAAPARHS